MSEFEICQKIIEISLPRCNCRCALHSVVLLSLRYSIAGSRDNEAVFCLENYESCISLPWKLLECVIELRTTSSQVRMSAPRNTIAPVSDQQLQRFYDHGQSYIRSFVIRILQSAGLNPLFSHVSTSLSMYLRRLMYALAPQRLTLCARPSAQLQVQQKHERFII